MTKTYANRQATVKWERRGSREAQVKKDSYNYSRFSHTVGGRRFSHSVGGRRFSHRITLGLTAEDQKDPLFDAFILGIFFLSQILFYDFNFIFFFFLNIQFLLYIVLLQENSDKLLLSLLFSSVSRKENKKHILCFSVHSSTGQILIDWAPALGSRSLSNKSFIFSNMSDTSTITLNFISNLNYKIY